LRASGFSGVNVTIPHKEAAFALAARHDDAARLSGAANVLLFHRDHVEGRNTDVAGLAASLEESLGREVLKNAVATVLGAGGAARGAVLALDSLGAAEIRVIARNPGRSGALAHDLDATVTATLRAFGWDDWSAALSGTASLLNATSAGMRTTSPLSLPLADLPLAAAVCDIVYDPLETDLLKAARARGHAVVDGLGMLMHQAVPAFAAFYGVTPKVTAALRHELEKALGHGG
jgi:shikimate dehydrogenase